MCGGQWESLARSSGALEIKGQRNAQYKSGMKPASTNELLESFVKANRFLPRQRRLNPSFCRHEVQHKADPKSRAKEFIRRQA